MPGTLPPRHHPTPFIPWRLSFSLAVACLALTACVPSSQLQQAVQERDRLRRENVELRKRLTEESVRRQEAQEAMRRAEGRPAPAQGTAGTARAGAVPPASTVEGRPEPARASATPAGIMSRRPSGEAATGGTDISEEDLQGTPAAEPGPAQGDDGILRVARHYRDRRQHARALEAYSRLIQEYPFSPLLPTAFMERGLIREKLGNRPEALSDFETVAQAFPGSAEAPKARKRAQNLRQH